VEGIVFTDGVREKEKKMVRHEFGYTQQLCHRLKFSVVAA